VRDLAVLFLHVLVTVARPAGPGGARSLVAESVLVGHQLLVLSRFEDERPISVPLIAWSPVCVRFYPPGPVDPFRDYLQAVHAPDWLSRRAGGSTCECVEAARAGGVRRDGY